MESCENLLNAIYLIFIMIQHCKEGLKKEIKQGLVFAFGKELSVDVTVVSEGLSNPIGGIIEAPVPNESKPLSSLSPARLGML